MEDLTGTPLFDFYTSSANDQRNIVGLPGNQIEFHYMGDRTLRFYVYSSGLDSQLKLYLLKDKELILEINERGVTEEISFYDYRIEEVNDFILEFDSTIDSDGCAVAIATVISPEFKSLLPASRDLNY